MTLMAAAGGVRRVTRDRLVGRCAARRCGTCDVSQAGCASVLPWRLWR